jgi:tRNA 2-thiouridine synthesizing protein A
VSTIASRYAVPATADADAASASASPAPAPAGAGATLDLRGLKCPLPVLRTKRALAALAPGEVLIVLATDPLAGLDIAHLCREDGHALESAETAGPHQRVTIRKGFGSRD